MNSKILALNSLPEDQRYKELFKCCSSKVWVGAMLRHFPFESEKDLFNQARLVWFGLSVEDHFEAFSHHPRIGERVQSGTWENQEQSVAQQGEKSVLEELFVLNQEYEKKFPHVFLICATGKSATQIRDALKVRLALSPETELINAGYEQSLITELRLKKLLEGFHQS